MITVPIREIHEMELSSLCNLACVYCPHPTLQREKGNMAWETFERTMEHIAYYCERGTQSELSLTGIGEAILYPRFPEALARSRQVIGDRLLVMATNGVAITDEIVRLLKEYNVRVYVSLHRPEVAVPAGVKMARAGIHVLCNHAFVDSSIDWGGQVKWHASASSHVCDYLRLGWASVKQNGSVTACCVDAHDLHSLGNVRDELGSLCTHAIGLCGACHLTVPLHMQEETNVRAA